MNREELISAATRITELRAEIARLSSLQKELKRLESLIDQVTGIAPTEKVAGSRISIEERVGQFIEQRADQDWDAEEVSKALDIKVPTTRAAFSKLRKAHRIIDTRRGRVQAKTDEMPTEENLTIKAA